MQTVSQFVSVLLISFSLLATSAQAASISALQATAKQQGDVPIIVKYKQSATTAGATVNSISALTSQTKLQRNGLISQLKKHSPKNIKNLDRLGLTAMRVNASGLNAIMNNPNVEAVFEDRLMTPSLLESTALIGANSPAAVAAGGAGQVVAVLDTGVEKSHPFLTGKVVHEACFSTTNSAATTTCPNNLDEQTGNGAGAACSISGCSHGTHVAGIVAGENSSYTGVAPDAEIIAIQVFSEFSADNCSGEQSCPLAYYSDVMRGLDYVYSLRNTYNIASVNLSLGGGFASSACDSHVLKNSVDLLLNANIATVIASGNDGFTNGISEPACISSAVSVGSTTKQDQVSSFSNSSSLVDLLAPGSSIASSVTGGGYANYSGTSMATPHVAGAFAVLRSHFPDKSVSELLELLKTNSTSITDSRNNLVKPRIQLDSAIGSVSIASEKHDFNIDGRSDIFWRHKTTGSNWMDNMNGPTVSSSSQIAGVADTRWKVVAIADLDGDADADILWRHSVNGNNWVHLMDGSTIEVSKSLNIVSDLNWEVAGAGDFDGNGTSDIVWRNKVNGSNWLYLIDGTKITASVPINIVKDMAWEIVGVDDFNGDGKADILWRNTQDGAVFIYVMDENRITASKFVSIVRDLNWTIKDTADLNNDGFADIIWHHSQSGSTWAFLMQQANVKESRSIGTVADTRWQIKKSGDFNGDGNGDILWRNSVSGHAWLFEMNGAQVLSSKSIKKADPNWEIVIH